MTTLPNGNIVVTDPLFDAPGPIADVGAVHLYRPDGALISTLRGTKTNDQVGSGGITVLSNGHYVVRSPNWDNGVAVDAGAVTFGSGLSGISGVVSVSNSLIGSTTDNQVGNFGVTALSNGHYVVLSPYWDNGAAVDVGAATFGSGVSGIIGVVSASNSLVGSTANNLVGFSGVTALSNGHYVVLSPSWDNGAVSNVGAATFGSGVSGIRGVVSASNSLVGSNANDQVGDSGVTALSNGNYVVLSRRWDNGTVIDAGAATFVSGVSGISGVVSASNSLVGNSTNDEVGSEVTALSNGHYVVLSPSWDNGAISNVGAATFGSGVSGISGLISASNSLVGSTANNQVGIGGVTALSNGNYVVASSSWDNGALIDVGAATFGSGVNGISGVVSASNSLVGSSVDDMVGFSGVTALSNGNYVVASPDWDNGAVSDVGSATFGSGVSGISGVVSASNSLVGSSAGDQVGRGSITALTNGHYVVGSRFWNNGAVSDVGAATFGSGVSGIFGVVSASNSLIGSTANNQVGRGVAALSNGHYVVRSPGWDNGAISNVGAATFGSGDSGISGVVSAGNSLIGSMASDEVGSNVTALSNGNYVVRSPSWNNFATNDTGAITLALANGSVTGPLTSTHSVLGLVANQGQTHTFGYDALRNQLAVGQPASNRVVLQRTGTFTAISINGDTPDPSIDNQPATFTATITATSAATSGQVTFRASSGETCTDTTPTIVSMTQVNFSCDIVFTSTGNSTVIAEYTGSVLHAYSRSSPEPHTANSLVNIFANGFEN